MIRTFVGTWHDLCWVDEHSGLASGLQHIELMSYVYHRTDGLARPPTEEMRDVTCEME